MINSILNLKEMYLNINISEQIYDEIGKYNCISIKFPLYYMKDLNNTKNFYNRYKFNELFCKQFPTLEIFILYLESQI